MIHKFNMLNKNIVLDVESGGVFVFDDLTFKMIDFIDLPMNRNCDENFLKKFHLYSSVDVLESYENIYELYAKKILFSPELDYDKFKNVIANGRVKAMCLHVAHDCNLRCAYCFASTGHFGGARELMSFETAKAAVDYLINCSGSRKNLEIDFFGGEPLMNFDVVMQTVDYARSLEKKFNKNFRFTITTNGTLLDDFKINYINSEMSNVVLSIDGSKKVNDRIRKMIDKNMSSYDVAMPKFLKLVKTRLKSNFNEYYVRGTFTNKNLNFVEDALHFYKCGFNKISIEPVVSMPSTDYAIRDEHLELILNQYELLARQIVELKKQSLKIDFFHFMIDLTQGPCLIKRLRGCGCGVEYLAVAPNGDLFPCHQFVGKNNFKMGSVYEKELNADLLKKFSEATLLNKSKCKKCWAKYYCGGGCNANNFNLNGDLLIPSELFCEMEKKRVECAIAIKAALV